MRQATHHRHAAAIISGVTLANVIDSMAERPIEVIAPANGAAESVLMRYLGQEGDSRRPSPTSNRTSNDGTTHKSDLRIRSELCPS